MTSRFTRPFAVSVIATATSMLLAACGGGGTSNSMPSPGAAPANNSAPGSVGMMTDARAQQLEAQAEQSDANDERQDDGSVLARFGAPVTIGSTVDPKNGDLNPYGLDVAKVSAGLISKGDLVVCNFNDSANVQGNGTTIIALHPQQGSSPTHIAQDASLKGCDALALAPNDNPWNAAFVANDNPIFTPEGNLVTTLANGPWHGPFGETFSPTKGPFGNAAFYVSNAATGGDGSIVRVNITEHGFTFDVIATGFAINGGAPGSILGPSGLQFDAKRDRLFIVDGADNSLTVFNFVSLIPTHGIVVKGAEFSGVAHSLARRVFAGAPLNGPISSALLADGHLVLGNTLDPNGTNLMVEITPRGKVLATKNVDTGAGGALFGMVATGTSSSDTKIYFNDDNTNTLDALIH
jgi:hypothetical protein